MAGAVGRCGSADGTPFSSPLNVSVVRPDWQGLEAEVTMKRFIVSLIAATMLLGAAGFAGGFHWADAPQCCQKHESCCPKGSCCSGGQHGECAMPSSHRV